MCVHGTFSDHEVNTSKTAMSTKILGKEVLSLTVRQVNGPMLPPIKNAAYDAV